MRTFDFAIILALLSAGAVAATPATTTTVCIPGVCGERTTTVNGTPTPTFVCECTIETITVVSLSCLREYTSVRTYELR